MEIHKVFSNVMQSALKYYGDFWKLDEIKADHLDLEGNLVKTFRDLLKILYDFVITCRLV